MQYKTIIHDLLQQRPQMHTQLRKERKLLPTMELYAKELKISHEAWTQFLVPLRPDSAPSQVSSEALEMALHELEARLPSESYQPDSMTHFLDAAMLFVRHRMPGA